MTNVILFAALESQSDCSRIVTKQRNSEVHTTSLTIFKTVMVAQHSDENDGMQTTSKRKKFML
jgi:hypothetical protein